jgi:hypothetical protein
VTNIRAVSDSRDSFRFTCHVTLDIKLISDYVKSRMQSEVEEVLLLPKCRKEQQEKELNEVLKKVPKLVLHQIQGHLDKIEREILRTYPNCSRVDLELDHSSELKNYSSDDEESIRIVSEEVEAIEFRQLLEDNDWLWKDIERLTRSGGKGWLEKQVAI